MWSPQTSPVKHLWMECLRFALLHWEKKKKNYVFLCIKLQLKFSISFYYECKQQTIVSVAVTCDFVTNGNHKCFRITKQLLQVPQKIVYLHRYLKITVVIRFGARFSYLVH